jgi:hypothetical protein
MSPTRPPRRAILKAAILGVAGTAVGATLSGCTGGRSAPQPTAGRSSAAGGAVLLAYFSRAGENYHYGGRRRLPVGNTQVVAQMISQLIGCDVHRIQAADPYPDDYEATVERNVEEQNADGSGRDSRRIMAPPHRPAPPVIRRPAGSESRRGGARPVAGCRRR